MSEDEKQGAPRQRRSLSNVGGHSHVSGNAALSGKLAHAFDVAPAGDRDDEPERAHVHGFHPYPARMHPVTAARLVAAFTQPSERVLDPFCGSGTVLVEAMLTGRMALGVDLNPLAVRLARLKTTRASGAPGDLDVARVVLAASAVARVADARRKARAGASRRFPSEDVESFAPHVLLELDSIRACLDGSLSTSPKLEDEVLPALYVSLSALLTKVSKRRGDTSEEQGEKRLAAGYATKLFVKKVKELGARMLAFSALLPEGYKKPRIVQGDATRLLDVAEASIDAIITSPPYAGTYDYLAHHQMRLRWLGLDARDLSAGELGARRDYATLDARDAEARYRDELASLLEACARVSKPGGRLVLLMADSATRSTALYADDVVADVAAAHGAFAPSARASQHRPHFHGPTAQMFGERPRAEHLLLLVKKSYAQSTSARGRARH